MTTQPGSAHHSFPAAQSPSTANLSFPAFRLFTWSVRREFWENRSLYLAPLAVAALIVVGSVIGAFHLPRPLQQNVLDAAEQQTLIQQPYTFAALLLMFSTFIAGAIYCLDALYGERRDRSILFWKSLPVSDLNTVLAKASIPLLVLPLLTFAITAMTQLVMFVVGSVRFAGTGVSLWSHLSLPHMWTMLLYHLVVVHSLWWAPYWAWLLLASAWARRAPFLWAVLPVLAISLGEKIAFNTTHFAAMLGQRFAGGPPAAGPKPNPMSMDALGAPAMQVLSSASFWIGLLVAAAFLAAAVRLRRSREPI